MIEGTAEEDQFFITLPSNSSEEFYGRQHPSNYRTRLETSIRLDPERWKVGMAEITYPKTWDNVKAVSLALITPEDLTIWTHLKANRFVSSKHLVRELQWALELATPAVQAGNVKVRYDVVSQRVRVTFSRGFALKIPYALAVPLGFSDENGSSYPSDRALMAGLTIPRDRSVDVVVEGSHPVYIDRSMPNIYVYCDLVRQQRVGDAYVPLLRTLNVPEKVQGDMVERQFTNIHYGALQRGVFDAVEIHMVDGTGENISFEHGHVIVKLHFKKKQ